MEKLTINQLVEGEIYATEGPTPGYIFMSEGTNRSSPYIHPLSGQYYRHGHLSSEGNNSFKHYRVATEEEKEHFLACHAAGRYVNPPAPGSSNPRKVRHGYDIF
jgi:hypothetical protein